MNAIIIDDELNSRQTLKLLLAQLCPQVKVVGEADHADAGIALLHKTNPDIVFLDIEMPGKNGFELLADVQAYAFDLIFTTAYHEHAVKAFRFSALDYLLKPIDPDELVSAVAKCGQKKAPKEGTQQLDVLKEMWQQLQAKNNSEPLQQKIALSNQDGIHIVTINDIVWCEALGSYTKFHFLNKSHMLVSKIIKEYEEMLHEYNFIRVHNTFLVNANYIVKYIKGDGGQLIMNDGSEIEVSRRKKDEVIAILAKMLK